MSKRVTLKERNWLLVIFSSLLIIFGSIIVVLSIVNFEKLGGLAIALIIGGLSTVILSIIAIVRNDPSWIFIDLLLP